MHRLPVIGVVTATLVLLVDQLSKWGVTHAMGLDALSDAYRVTGFFNVRFVANHGVSLGLLHVDSDAMRWALVVLTGAIAGGVAVWMTRERATVDRVALGLVLGGALGNIADRVRLGYVVDFADLHIGDWRPFLVFNVGDAAITVGVLILFIRALLLRDGKTAPVENDHA